jgi:hypothetical protein
MKRCAILILVLLCLSSLARADRLLIYSDAALTDSTLNDNSPRIANLYVVHDMFRGTGIYFRIAPGAGFTGVWLGETTAFVKIGNSGSDISIGYGACLTGPYLVLTISYQLFGTSAACSAVQVAPVAGLPCVFVNSGCGFVELCVYDLGEVHVNCAVPTEATTWGKVKALYRD